VICASRHMLLGWWSEGKGDKRNATGKKPLGRPRHGWEDGMKLDFKGIGWESIVWINLAQDKALVNLVMKLQFP